MLIESDPLRVFLQKYNRLSSVIGSLDKLFISSNTDLGYFVYNLQHICFPLIEHTLFILYLHLELGKR